MFLKYTESSVQIGEEKVVLTAQRYPELKKFYDLMIIC